ncbi:type II toxin-antitoxin system prevent-host-death family antitoxin [Streptomyces asiaticus]
MSEPAIRQLGVSEARANMTEVIAEVRLLGKPVALTRRDKPQVMLISMDHWKKASLDAEVRPFHEDVVRRLKALLKDPEFSAMLEQKDHDLYEVLEGDML